MYKLSFDLPNLPKGGEIDITGLNRIFNNGEEYFISAEEAEAYRVTHSVVLSDGKQTLGPTLLEAYQDNQYVNVNVVKPVTSAAEGRTK